MLWVTEFRRRTVNSAKTAVRLYFEPLSTAADIGNLRSTRANIDTKQIDERFDPFKHNPLGSLACVVIGFFVVRRLPVPSDWVILCVNWIFAAFTFYLGFRASREQRFTLLVVATLCFSVQFTSFIYDSWYNPFISVEWPTEVPSNEALIGGSLRSLDPADTVLKVYVCVKTANSPACYLDQDADSPSIRKGYWYAPVRFGNERRDNDHGNPEFFVVAAAVASDQLSRLPDGSTSKPLPPSAPELVHQLTELGPRALAGPFLVSKRYIDTLALQFTSIEEQNPLRSISLPPLREADYAVCAPLAITWSDPKGGRSVAAVEAWQDGRVHGSAENALSYRIDKWPANVERIEIKISSARGKGPYDSVWLKRGACAS